MTRFDYKETLDFVIVEIFEKKHPSTLRYSQLEKEISLYCKLSSATLSRHLKSLVHRNILEKKRERDVPIFYSLTKEFKKELAEYKKDYPSNYIGKILSSPKYRYYKGRYSPFLLARL